MITERDVVQMIAIHNYAAELARNSLEVGKPFLGAFGVAHLMGFRDDSPEFKAATWGAYDVFNKAEIITDNNGLIIELGGAQ